MFAVSAQVLLQKFDCAAFSVDPLSESSTGDVLSSATGNSALTLCEMKYTKGGKMVRMAQRLEKIFITDRSVVNRNKWDSLYSAHPMLFLLFRWMFSFQNRVGNCCFIFVLNSSATSIIKSIGYKQHWSLSRHQKIDRGENILFCGVFVGFSVGWWISTIRGNILGTSCAMLYQSLIANSVSLEG